MGLEPHTLESQVFKGPSIGGGAGLWEEGGIFLSLGLTAFMCARVSARVSERRLGLSHPGSRPCDSLPVVSACAGLFGVAQQLLWRWVRLPYGCE